MNSFDQMGSGIIVGGILIHGIEIVFDAAHDPRGRTWIPFTTGSKLVYGRNGVGKSTVIQAVKSAFGLSPAPPNCRVDLYFEFVRNENSSLTEEPALFDLDSDEERLFTKEISDSYWWVEGVRCYDISERDKYAEIASLLSDDPQLLMTTEQWVSTTWGIDEAVALPQVRLAYLAYQLCEDEGFWDGGGERPRRDLVVDAYSEVASQGLYCLTAFKDVTFASIAAEISSDTPALMTLASEMAISVDTAITTIEELSPQFSEGIQGVLNPDFVSEIIESEFLYNLGPTLGLVDWDHPATQFARIQPTHNFVRLRSWHHFCDVDLRKILGRRNFPHVVDLDRRFSATDWVTQQLLKVFDASYRSSWDAVFSGSGSSDPTAVIESERLANVERLHSNAGAMLSRIDVGLCDIRLRMSNDLRDWVRKEPATLECLDKISGSWVGFARLSDAQQKIVAIVLSLQQDIPDDDDDDETEPPELPIILGDEIDRGLHQMAVRDLYRLLRDVSRLTFISTHSPTALSLPGHTKLHAYRDGSARLELAEWFPSQDSVDSESRALGIDKLQLLATVQIVVVVEGAHDEAVLDEIIAAMALTNQLLRNVVVLPMQGHKGVATIADSLVWVTYTDAHIVCMVDNSQQDKLGGLLQAALDMMRSGMNASKIVKALEIPKLAGGASTEERSMLALIEQAIRNGIPDRVHLEMLSRRDIIEYLPPEAFGLQEDWDVLRAEFLRIHSGTDFKSWLRETRGAQISVNRVRSAAAGLDRIPEELSAVMSTVAALLGRSY